MSLNGGYQYSEQLGPAARGQTLLAWLCARYPHGSETEWQERIKAGELTLDGQPPALDTLLRPGQTLVWNRPPWQEPDAPLSYEIVYIDEALLAVHKPGGLPTLPGGGYLEHSLLHLVRHAFPGATPLHRLGRATSGLTLFARTRQAAAQLSQRWREREVEKHYRALATGLAEKDLYDIRTPIGPVEHPRLGTVYAASPSGKASHSQARVLERRAAHTLFTVQIFTGRPHQIRIHLAAAGHPLAGDPLYGPGGMPLQDHPGLPGDGGYLLHAEMLRFRHPLTGETLELRAPPPTALQEKRG